MAWLATFGLPSSPKPFDDNEHFMAPPPTPQSPSLPRVPSQSSVSQDPPHVRPPRSSSSSHGSRVAEVLAIVSRLVYVCDANQDTIRSLVDEVRALCPEVSRTRPPPPPLTPRRGPPPPPVSTRVCPPPPVAVAHQLVVGCHLSHAVVLGVKIDPTRIVQPVSATRIGATLVAEMLCLAAVGISTHPVILASRVLSRRRSAVPFGSPPPTTRAAVPVALHQAILSAPRDIAMSISTAADVRTIPASPKETARVEWDPKRSSPSALCTVKCAPPVDVGYRRPRPFPWFDVSLVAALGSCCLCARTSRSTFHPSEATNPTGTMSLTLLRADGALSLGRFVRDLIMLHMLASMLSPELLSATNRSLQRGRSWTFFPQRHWCWLVMPMSGGLDQ